MTVRLLVEHGRLFHPTKKTIINESNAKAELPKTIYDYVKLDNGKTLLKVEGIVADFIKENGNGRFYSEAVWDHVLESNKHVMKDILEHNAWGVLEHPSDGETRLGEVSHRILSLRKESSGHIIGEILIVDTAAGRDLRAMFESGGTVGISSRGWGDTQMRNGREEVVPGFVCETWDFVKVNSVADARFNTSTNARQASAVAQEIVSESSTKDNSDTMLDVNESKINKNSEPVNSSNESTLESFNNILLESIIMTKKYDLEVSQLKTIAESKMDRAQLNTVLSTAELSMTSISEALDKKEINKIEAEKLLKRYSEVVETAKKNDPAVIKAQSLKESKDALMKRYNALSKLTSGVLERFKTLKEDYENLAESTTDSKDDKTKNVSEADNNLSKRYNALLSITEELLKRTVQSSKVVEKVKARAAKISEKAVATQTELFKLKLEALKQPLSEKAALLIYKCKSKEQIEKVLDRVKKLSSVVEDSAVKEENTPNKVESQAHKEPLPGDALSENQNKSETVELHESVSLIAKMRS